MPATKMQRRKATPSSRLSSKSTAPLQQHNASMNIGSFARVSKAIGGASAKDLDVKSSTSTPATIEIKLAVAATSTTPSSRKRKTAAASDDESCTQQRASKRISSVAVPPTTTPSKRAIRSTRVASLPQQTLLKPTQQPQLPQQQQRSKRARSPTDSDAEESTINAGALFKKLRLREASPTPATPPLTPDASGISDCEGSTPDILPDEVLGLIDLHAALLKTLTLHYAHNGANTPADLRRLLPDVARSWRLRKVSEAEVQTCIGVLAASTSRQPFSLINYGFNKICVELDVQSSNIMFNEKELNSLFYENLFTLWRSFCSAHGESADGNEFLHSLPKATISVSESFTKAAPIFAKGQQRLEDLKQGIAAKKLEKEASAAAVDTPMANADGTKMSLLDRIRHKALQKAQAPAGLSPAELERRAALQRAAEVAALIGMLSRATAGGGRMSFTMTAMLVKLKDTFRMGISREEGAACVRLLGKEVAPEWIKVVVIGGRENVVIDTNRMLGKADIERRVQQLL
ncbi:hypothetical protein Micbo1qcDRAFT_163497 [Microdochium bolleyi]|uniref:DNA replication factor Cdt1 C-terminal domain-containing protein n=1 Tax=Microdochium bolleyi TaxID=196109 RepID=A0A136J1F4_9PEZI|nr:hypothetical protein Micbo1qcDRAFT_163497 [Microdochium bolleyi]